VSDGPQVVHIAQAGRDHSPTLFSSTSYLHDAGLRREIHDGLNVIEQWNGANDFVFFARRGELASNRCEDHEVSMLALHLLQNCMIYVNTLTLQQVWCNRTGGRRSNPAT
jgi:TnpA family transposase